MEPEIITREKMLLVGLVETGQKVGDIDISGLWNSFEKFMFKIEHANIELGYELHQDIPGGQNKTPRHCCLVAVEVTEIGAIPDECFVKVVPAAKYAVFTHQFKDGGYSQAFKLAYDWLEDSDYSLAHHFDIQVYDENFKGAEDPDSWMKIYIPVR